MTPSPFITIGDLATLLARPKGERPHVLDASYLLEKPVFDGDYRARSAWAQWKAAHIPGSMYVDIQQQFSDPAGPTHFTHPEPQAIADELARLGIPMTGTVVVYDMTQTMFAARLWYLLTWIGVDARVLDGGLDAWMAAGLPVETGDATGEAVRTPPPIGVRPVRDAWVTKRELESRSESDARPLVCGLPSGSFSGADPTRYSRRGHIPGSVNVSSRDLFAPDGTVKSESDVREAYLTAGVTGDEEVLLYCGGGISATANALTLAGLGVTAVRVYDGSLEEWSADPSVPLAVGGVTTPD